MRTMARLSRALALLSLLGGTFFLGTAARSSKDPSLMPSNTRRLRPEAVKRGEYFARDRSSADGPRHATRASGATDTSPPSRVQNITFTNPKASGTYYARPRFHGLPPFFCLTCF